MSFLNRLLDPRFTSSDPRVNLLQWKNDRTHVWSKYFRESPRSDQISRSICLNKIAPVDVRQHLMLNQQRLDAADAISDEIGESCEVVGGFREDAKERACENVRSE